MDTIYPDSAQTVLYCTVEVESRYALHLECKNPLLLRAVGFNKGSLLIRQHSYLCKSSLQFVCLNQ